MPPIRWCDRHSERTTEGEKEAFYNRDSTFFTNVFLDDGVLNSKAVGMPILFRFFVVVYLG